VASAYCKPLINTEEMDRDDDGKVDEFQKTVENTEEIREKEHLSEGDMVLNAAQLALMEGTDRALDLSGDGSKTNGGKWPKTGKLVNIPYTVDPNNMKKWSKTQKANFNKALKSFETNTCIRFVQRKKEANYLYIKDGGGCWSKVGMNTGKQDLSLEKNCLNEVGTPIHELMHAIGYMHEQSRSDRDTYITVNYNNIRSGMKRQFDKCKNCDLQGLAYDTGSVMQYHETAFSKDGTSKTMVSKDGSKLGQDNGFSKLDLKGINMIYCGGTAPATTTAKATTAKATTAAPATAAPATTQRPQTTTTTSQTSVCQGNLRTFDAGYGECWTYANDLPKWLEQWGVTLNYSNCNNKEHCKTVNNKKLCASDVCPECGCIRN